MTAIRSPAELMAEDVLTLPQASRELEPIIGRRLHAATIHRWCTRGVGGVRLEHCRIGRIYYTSRQALTRFIDASTRPAASKLANRAKSVRAQKNAGS